MNKPFLLSFTLLIFTLTMAAQTDTIPFKGVNTIIIETGLSNGDALDSWGRHLSQNDFTIDKYDDLFFSLTTDPEKTSKYNWVYVVKSSIADTGIIVTQMEWRINTPAYPDYWDWDYMKGKGNAQGRIYLDLLPVIESFGDYRVTYEKRR
jgi:hypothetical protein